MKIAIASGKGGTGETTTIAQRSAKCIVEFPESKIAVDIENMGTIIDDWLNNQ